MMMTVLTMAFCLMGASLEQELAAGGKRRSGVTSIARPTMGLSIMVQWSVANGCVWMDVRRLEALFDVVVTSTADGTVYAMIPLEDETAEDDGGES